MPHSNATHWPRILVLWLCGIFAAIQFAKISFAFSPLREWYAVSPAQMGLVLSTVGMVGLVAGVTVGLYAHAIGYKRLLLGGLCLGAVLALVQSWLPPYGWFWATRVLEGASHLAVVVSAPTLIAQSCAPRHRSIAMGLWSTFVGVAFALTAAVGAAALAQFGLPGFLRLHAAGMALMALAAYALVPADPLGRVRQWHHPSAVPRQHVQIYTQWVTALPGLCFSCYTIMAVALLTFLPQLAGADRVWLAVVLPLMSIAGNFCAGWLAQLWLSPLVLVRVALGAVGASAIALWLASGVGFSIAPFAMALMFMAGLAGGSAFALIPYLSHEPLVQSRANGAVAQMGNLGSTLGPPLFAALIAQLGMAGLALSVVVFAGLGIGLATVGARQHTGAP